MAIRPPAPLVARQHTLAKELAIGAIAVFAAPALKARQRHRRHVEGTGLPPQTMARKRTAMS
jgi:hypothetical protein